MERGGILERLEPRMRQFAHFLYLSLSTLSSGGAHQPCLGMMNERKSLYSVCTCDVISTGPYISSVLLVSRRLASSACKFRIVP